MIDIGSLPSRRVGPGQVLTRIFRTLRQGAKALPWHYSSTTNPLSGRFDLEHPRGTCYFSDELAGCWVEVFRTMSVVPLNDVESRSVALVERCDDDVVLADLTSPAGVTVGVTLDVSAGHDRTTTQNLAASISAHGWDGVTAWIRHDPAARYRNLAVFGDGGSHPEVPGWRVSVEPLVLRAAQVAAQLGVRVGPIPFDLPISPP